MIVYKFVCTGNDAMGPGKIRVMMNKDLSIPTPLSFEFESDDGKRRCMFGVHKENVRNLAGELVKMT